MTDDRPKPQYGEYAPEGWVSPHYPPPRIEDVVVVPMPGAVTADVSALRRSRDRVVTFGLLGFGLFLIVYRFAAFLTLDDAMRQLFTQLGMGDFTSDGFARSVGLAANILQVVLWLAAALRAGRTAFWWPLGAGLLANLIISIMFVVVMINDPAYAAYLAQFQP